MGAMGAAMSTAAGLKSLLARAILAEYAPQRTNYIGIDSSKTMVDLSRKRLAEFGDRARVYETEGTPNPGCNGPANGRQNLHANFQAISNA